jgi:hypothetical protein
MDPTSSKVSPVLREVAGLKIEELDRRKQAFRHRCPDNKQTERPAILEKLSSLVDDGRTFDPYLEDEKKLFAVVRYVGKLEKMSPSRKLSCLYLIGDLEGR